MPILITIITVLLHTPPVEAYTITPISINPGLYLEYVKEMKVTREPWTIGTIITLQPLLFNSTVLLDKLKEVSNQCPYSRQTCDYYLSRSRLIIEKINSGVQTSHHIWELIDNDSYNLNIPVNSNHFTTNFDKIHKGKRISSLVSPLNSIIDKVTSQYTQIQGKYLRTSGVPPRDYYNYVETFLSALEALAETYTTASRSVMEAILHAKGNLVSPGLFSKHWISLFPSDEQPSTMNQIFLYNHLYSRDFSQITTIQVSRNGPNVTILIDIPIFKDDAFYLYRLHPLPVPIGNNQTMHIQPSANYLADGPETHILLDSLEHCLERSTVIYCNQEFVYKRDHDCEKGLLMDQPNYQDCRYVFNNANETTWIRLRESNEWIFSAPIADQVNISCSGHQTSLIIEGMGILQPDDNCQLSTSSVNIDLEFKNPLTIVHYLPRFPLYIPPITNSLPNNTPNSYLALVISSFSSLIICLVVIIVLLIRKYRKIQSPHVTPAPRELLHEVPLPAISEPLPMTTTHITFRAPSPPPTPEILPPSSPKTRKTVRIKSDPEIKYLEPEYDNHRISNLPVSVNDPGGSSAEYAPMVAESAQGGCPQYSNLQETAYVTMNRSSDCVCIDIYDLPPPTEELLRPENPNP